MKSKILLKSLFIESFWKYIVKGKKNECWNWKGSLTHGYGQIHRKGKQQRAHRLSYEIFYGKIPKNAHICHQCNNRACCNPYHLYAGDYYSNTQDKIKAGTQYYIPIQRGEKNNKTKLTEKKVKEIRLKLKKGISQQILSKEYNVSPVAISCINTGKSWNHTIKNKNELFQGKGKGNIKLSKNDVFKIRKMKGKNIEIAAKFGVCSSTIGKIKKHLLWSNI